MREKIKNIIKDKYGRRTLLTFVVVLILAGVSFAWFNATVTGNEDAEGAEVTTANLSITYNGGPEYNQDNILPGWSGTKTFRVENTGDATATYNINWETLTNGFTNQGNVPVTYNLYWSCIANSFTRTQDLTYTLTSTNDGGTVTNAILPMQFSGDVVTDVTIPTNTVQTYTLTITYSKLLATDQSVDMDKTFKGIIDVWTAGSEKEENCPPTFAETLLDNTPPTTVLTTTPGQEAATTDEGLIEGPNDDYGDITYYYRGAVTNNYVSFAGFTWRIIRINGNGTVRMILDDYTDTTGSAWNTNNASTDYATAMEYATYGNSTVKTVVDTWYNTNIGNNTTYSSKVATTKYCSDKSGITSFTGETQLFAPRNRIYPVASSAPIMTCPDTNDIYNLKVGLITADEVAFAGSGYPLTNQSYYLYNSNITTPVRWWALSLGSWSYEGFLTVFSVYAGDGDFANTAVNGVWGIRPVISLNRDVTPTTASPTNPGTSSNPYIIQ